MPISVRGPDGTIYRVNTDDENVARQTVRGHLARQQQEQQARIRSGDPRVPGSVVGAMAGRAAMRPPQGAYEETLTRRARERAPQGRPGTFLRGLEDFNRSGPTAVIDQMMRNIGIADEVAGASEFLQSGGNPEAARAGAAYERGQQQRVEREQPGVNMAANIAAIPAFAGSPVAAGPMSALRAGAAGAAVNAPFALARQEGSLQERLPGAALETGAVFAAGAGLQGIANRLMAPARPNSMAARAADFEAAGVRPTIAAVAGGTPAGATRMISENFLAGAPARARIQASIDDTAEAARRLAAQAGEVSPREVVGETVQRGVRRFAQGRNVPQPSGFASARATPIAEWSFPAKASALYDDVFSRLARDEAAMVGQVDGPLLSMDATQEALQQIRSRVAGPASREAMASPMIERMAQALTDDAAAGALRFQDLRQWRTWVREAQRNEGLRQGLDNAALQRLESALTQDIYASAMMIGGRAADDLRSVDRWYRRVSNRINEALEPFAQGGGAQAYRRIIDLASQGGRQNSRSLEQLRASLRPDEWRQVSATIIDELGNPSFGAPNVLEPGAFSVERFVTNYARLSPEGRRLLFGPLTNDLDTLARVAGYQKGVEAMANRSRSGVNVQNVGTAAGLFNPSTTAPTFGLLAGMTITGEALTNPAFVRWIASAPRNGNPAGMRRHLAGLATIAGRDPAIAPIYGELAQRLTSGSSADQESQNARAQ